MGLWDFEKACFDYVSKYNAQMASTIGISIFQSSNFSVTSLKTSKCFLSLLLCVVLKQCIIHWSNGHRFVTLFIMIIKYRYHLAISWVRKLLQSSTFLALAKCTMSLVHAH